MSEIEPQVTTMSREPIPITDIGKYSPSPKVIRYLKKYGMKPTVTIVAGLVEGLSSISGFVTALASFIEYNRNLLNGIYITNTVSDNDQAKIQTGFTVFLSSSIAH